MEIKSKETKEITSQSKNNETSKILLENSVKFIHLQGKETPHRKDATNGFKIGIVNKLLNDTLNKKILLLTDSPSIYKELTKNHSLKIINPQGRKYLIDSSYAETELFEELRHENEDTIIVIDNIRMYIPEYIYEPQNKSMIREEKLIQKLTKECKIKSKNYILMDDTKTKLEDIDAEVKSIKLFYTKQEDILYYDIVNTGRGFFEYQIKPEPKEINTWIFDEVKTRELVRTNIPNLDKLLIRSNISIGDIFPFNISIENKKSKNRTATRILLKTIIVKADFNIPILYIAPFDEKEQFKRELALINRSNKIDKKAIQRLTFKGANELVNNGTYNRKKSIDIFIQKEIKEMRLKVGNQPFYTLVDMFDIEYYKTKFDYGELKMIARGLDTPVIICMSNTKKRYQYAYQEEEEQMRANINQKALTYTKPEGA